MKEGPHKISSIPRAQRCNRRKRTKTRSSLRLTWQLVDTRTAPSSFSKVFSQSSQHVISNECAPRERTQLPPPRQHGPPTRQRQRQRTTNRETRGQSRASQTVERQAPMEELAEATCGFHRCADRFDSAGAEPEPRADTPRHPEEKEGTESWMARMRQRCREHAQFGPGAPMFEYQGW